MKGLSVWTPWGRVSTPWLDTDEDFFEVSDTEMDVYEEKDNVVVKLKAPGFRKENVDISIESGKITVVGKMKEETEEENKDKKYYRKEIRQKSFTRSCALPVSVTPDKASAAFEDGVLTITLPKSEEAKPKKINIDVK